MTDVKDKTDDYSPDSVWTLYVIVEDAEYSASTHMVHLPTSSYSYTDAVCFANLYAKRLQRCLEGAIRRVTITRDLGDMGISATPTSRADIEAGLFVVFRLASGRHAVTLATWSESSLALAMWSESYLTLPPNNPDVLSWLSLMLDAPSQGLPANPCDRHGAPILALDKVSRTLRCG